MNGLKKLTCDACQGWGHTTIDGNGDSKYKFCVTNKIIDIVRSEATDKREFDKEIGKKEKPAPEKTTLKMNSKYLERMVLVSKDRA